MHWLRAMPPWLFALPWLMGPLFLLRRFRDCAFLKDYEPFRGPHAPRISVIIPARNESLNIERCVRSILATTYTNIEVIIVDDHSTDCTGYIARGVVADDARARVTTPPPLPEGWFGKQWACAHGASLATGDLLLFTDADTWHSPGLLALSAGALRSRNADLLSLAGRQEAESFWERVVQPTLFLGFVALYGGTEQMSRARNPRKKIANGQFIFVRRDVYDLQDGHAAVRAYAAEDMMLAQTWTAAGRSVHVVVALEEFSTRMYRSLGEIIRGWGKNAWTAGRHIIGNHPVLRAVARVATPFVSLLGVIPVAALLLGASGIIPSWWMLFGVWAYLFETAVWFVVYLKAGASPLYALLYPLGCIITAYIFARASIRGDRTEWKGREYMAA